MKTKQNELSALKKKLRLHKANGEKSVCWFLTKEQQKYLIQLGYELVPECYKICTRRFFQVKSLPSILKDIHYSKINNEKYITRKLKKGEKKLLEKYNVIYYPIKFYIVL